METSKSRVAFFTKGGFQSQRAVRVFQRYVETRSLEQLVVYKIRMNINLCLGEKRFVTLNSLGRAWQSKIEI